MGIWNNLKKTYYYSRKNGIKNACYATVERVLCPYHKDYKYEPISADEEQRQKKRLWDVKTMFSIVVPAYRTDVKYLRELMESVLNQTYSNFELIIADAGGEITVEEIVKEYGDERIRYILLEANEGISANTNVAVKEAKGDYIGLLDHDDLLTKDALYEMALRIEAGIHNNKEYVLLYSDEDKCDENTRVFYEPHYKTEFNRDLILSNNYICHFMVVKTEVFKELLLRSEYDGAQDYDFVLRCVEKFWDKQELLGHVPKILYHWRCHSASTAANPQSKMYAYEAGKRALEDFVKEMDWKAQVEHSKHLGFYRIVYQPDVFNNRKDIGVVGGRVICDNKIIGVIISKKEERLYRGMPQQYAGYMNRISLPREVNTVDIRNMRIVPDLRALYKEVTGMTEEEARQSDHISEQEAEEMSIRFCRAVREAGYRVVYEPSLPDVKRKKRGGGH